jgi:ATP-dependent protease ClpP protease subunit
MAEFDLEKKRVWLPQILNGENAQTIERCLLELADKDDKQPVVLFCNSGGGQAFAGFYLARLLPMLPYPVATVVTSAAESMAALIYAFGDYRFMTKAAILNLHQIHWNNGGMLLSRDAFQAEAKGNQALDDAYWECLEKSSSKVISMAPYRSAYFQQVTSKDCEKIGLVEHVFATWSELQQKVKLLDKKR